MGTNAIGAMIVAGAQGFMKTHYRTFNIRSEELTPGDDYGMMREVLKRRFTRLAKEQPRKAPEPIDAAAIEPSSLSREAEGLAPDSQCEDPTPSLEGSAQSASEPPQSRLSAPSELGPRARRQRGEVDESVVYATRVRAAPAPAREEDPDAFPAWPDLVLIDGGRGQLQAALTTLAEIGIADVPVAAIAKGPDRDAGMEQFHLPVREPFRLEPRDPALYFMQRLRDEAHRFAIGTHRAKRSRELVRSPLDEIEGVGPRRKRALLLHFGTVKAIERASLEDLASAPGVNAATAKAVYGFFHPQG
jgi:excinuclease ABC subunit C